MNDKIKTKFVRKDDEYVAMHPDYKNLIGHGKTRCLAIEDLKYMIEKVA